MSSSFSPVSLSPEHTSERSDRNALVFWLACLLFSAPMVFAGQMPRGLLLGTALLLLAAFVWRGLQTRTLLPRSAVNWANVALLLALPVGWWASTDHAASAAVIFKTLAGFAAFYGFANLAGTRWPARLPALWLAFSAVLGAVMLLSVRWTTAKLSFLPASLYSVLPTARLPWQPEGFHPNVAGSSLGWLLLPALALALWGHGRRLRRSAALTAMLLAVVVLLSQSRGAWMGLLFAAAAVLALRWPRWRTIFLTALALGLAAALLIGPARVAHVVLPDSAAGETSVNTLPGRLELWQRALVMLHDSGMTGIGPGQFESVARVLYPPFYIGMQGAFYHTHNLYLQMALDFGVLGLAAFAALLMGMAASLVAGLAAWPQLTGQDRSLAALAAGIFGSLIALAAHGLLDSPQVPAPSYWLIFALLGSAAAIIQHFRASHLTTQ